MKIDKIISKRGIISIYHCLMYLIMYFLSQILKKAKKNTNIWLICERNDEAKDNGYHMFKYIRKNYPNVNIHYIIKKNCDDRRKVEKFGNVINFGSLKHILYYFNAERHISTHINGCSPNERAYLLLNKLFNINAKIVFLQHGIIKDYLKGATASFAHLDLFVCGAYPEYKYVLGNFGYSNSVIKYLGLARFDYLHNQKTKKQILLMPTFRMDLYIYSDDEVDKKREDYFLDSEFYRAYQSLINNLHFQKILERNNMELIFYPHYEIQKYLHLFRTDNKYVKIADHNNYDIQTLLKESKLLITDYSSVYFDFAYMQKPIIYYHFDYNEYRKVHYKEGYFSYADNGFGPIAINEIELIKQLEDIENSGFIMSETYADRTKGFFRIYDQNNRERNYRAILNIK